MNIEMKEVKSSNVSLVGYEDKSGTLRIMFKGKFNGAYDYNNVTPDEYDDLMKSESIGKHLNQKIKPNHRCDKISEEQVREPRDKNCGNCTFGEYATCDRVFGSVGKTVEVDDSFCCINHTRIT